MTQAQPKFTTACALEILGCFRASKKLFLERCAVANRSPFNPNIAFTLISGILHSLGRIDLPFAGSSVDGRNLGGALGTVVSAAALHAIDNQ